MTSKTMTNFRVGLAVLMAGSGLVAPAAAQTSSAAFGETAGNALTRHLRTIADQPRNVSALTGAGKAALELGDAQAALTFFARAEEIAPRDGRIKAGMGAAFVQMEQVLAGLKFFQDAASLGVPEAEFAGDRGLAYDLSGDPRRAQADYALALRRQEDPEIRRRLALSLAISGDRDKAIATIDGQLRNQDRAAWRVRSFILALTGDPGEATRSAEAVMPAQAAQMRPFFAALPGLKPAERAMAVHFGHFPDDGRPGQMASLGTQYASAAPVTTDAARTGEQTALARRAKTPEPVSTAARRRPGSEETERRTSDFVAERVGRSARPAATRKKPETKTPSLADAGSAGRTTSTAPSQPPVAREPASPAQQPPVRLAEIVPQPIAPAPSQPTLPSTQPPVASGPSTQAQNFDLGAARTSPIQAAPGIQLAEIAPSQVQSQTTPATDIPTAAPRVDLTVQPQALSVRATGLAAIAAAIESLPGDSAGPGNSTGASPPTPNLQVASTTPKPVYGPKFETAKPQPAKAAPVEKKADTVKKDDAKAIAAKKDDAKALAAKKAEDVKAAAAKKESAAKLALAKKEEAAKVKESSRHWVQIAGGANEAAMNREFLRLKSKAPKLLATRTAWTTPLRATNRLLVGPFKSNAEAQDFVNELSKLNLSAFSWTSPAGQEIVKLASK